MQDFCLKNLDVSLDQGILDTHKGSFGHLLIAGGDTGYGGAGIIASEAAIMSGCGLLRVYCLDLRELNRLIHEVLLKSPCVSRVQSQIVMDQCKADSALPI